MSLTSSWRSSTIPPKEALPSPSPRSCHLSWSGRRHAILKSQRPGFKSQCSYVLSLGESVISLSVM